MQRTYLVRSGWQRHPFASFLRLPYTIGNANPRPVLGVKYRMRVVSQHRRMMIVFKNQDRVLICSYEWVWEEK